MKHSSVFFLGVLLIQVTTGRPPNGDKEDYEERQHHAFVFSSSGNPGKIHTAIMKGPAPFPPMNFGFDSPRQNFGMFGSGGLGGFPNFGSMPGFPPLGSMSGGFGAGSGQSFKIPGGMGQIGGFSGSGSTGGMAFAHASSSSPGGSNSQTVMKPGGFAFTQTSSSGPGGNQVSVSSQSSGLQDGISSGAGEEDTPSIAVEF